MTGTLSRRAEISIWKIKLEPFRKPSVADAIARFVGTEIDVMAGITPGPLFLDLGCVCVHYFYTPEHVSPDYGEAFTKADYISTTSPRWALVSSSPPHLSHGDVSPAW
jgi:hypothetical protein